MSAQPGSPSTPQPASSPERETPGKPGRSMSRTQKILFFATGWLIVLMPFLFWWNTWFGRHLSDPQMTEYLHDDKKPRHIQHALVQLGDRMSRGDAAAKQWYPDLVHLAGDPVEEVRNTDAWVMGQDISGAGFHDTLRQMLTDSSPTVRGNAALSLVRFGDATGRPQIVALLAPAEVRVPTSGQLGPSTPDDFWSDRGRTASVVDRASPGTSIRELGVVVKLGVAVGPDGTGVVELRSPITGRVRTMSAVQQVHPGDVLAVIDPATEQVWEALRALYLVGQTDDLPAIRPYERDLPGVSNDVRQQAIETEKAIQKRSQQ
jgi:hypothetical protein